MGCLQDLRFVAVVRDKLRLVDYALRRRRIDPAYRYDPAGHELYGVQGVEGSNPFTPTNI